MNRMTTGKKDTRASDTLIFGANRAPGLVAVEPPADDANPAEMTLFFREGGRIRAQCEPFKPFLWVTGADLPAGFPGALELQPLTGAGWLKTLVTCPNWKTLDKLVAWLKKKTGYNPSDPAAPFFLINDPVQQHLMRTGHTLFKDMRFGDLRRLQLDIETYSTGEYDFSNPERVSDRIIAIALADQSGWTEVLSGARLAEPALLEQFVALVRERDPDVIEGHNLFKFDLPYIIARARRHGVTLSLGRDGRPPETRPSRFSVAERTITYPRCEIYGRHVVDTFFLAQAYDVSHRSLESFGLKDIAVHFGVAAPDRTYLEGREIARTFDRAPEQVMQYARDDILETRAISDLLSPSYFTQAQILPFAYQNICVRGSGAKIDALLLREYLRQGQAIPQPDAPREFAGGYTDIFRTGVIRQVHHCDVRSLYPSIILKDRRGPKSDDLGVFLKLLAYLRDLRLETKRRMQTARSAEERHNLEAQQSTFKILINSFYGYLGFAQARFSDFAAAEQITAEGRALLQQMIDWLRAHGGQPVEIDTDGIYFVPPEFADDRARDQFRRAFQAALPAGIEVEFDGEYPAMFSYKMKNYALLEANGGIIIKGAALKSRGLEPFQRDFMEEWLRLKLSGRENEIPALAERYRAGIRNREWPIARLAKTETLQDSPATYQAKQGAGGRARNAAYELALKSGRDYRAGDQIAYYVTGDRKSVPVHTAARLVSEWNPERRDENVPYYLAKLDALLEKFAESGSDPAQPELDLGG